MPPGHLYEKHVYHESGPGGDFLGGWGLVKRQPPKRTAAKRSQPWRPLATQRKKPERFKLLQMANVGAMCQGMPTYAVNARIGDDEIASKVH
jgi:hypothetical protein